MTIFRKPTNLVVKHNKLDVVIMDIVADLRKHSRNVFRELGLHQNNYKRLGVSLSESHILLSVIENPCSTLGDVAKTINLDKSTTSRHVDGMVKKGWLQLDADPSDKRRRFLTITPSGSELANKIHNEATHHVSSAMQYLSLENQQIVLKGMQLYAEALEKTRAKEAISIIPLSPEHDKTLTRLIVQVLEEYNCNKPGFAAKDHELHHMYATYQQPGYAYFIVLLEGKVVGGAGIAPLEGGGKEICELRKMYLLPETRGLGIGKKLMDTVLRAACELGYKKCYLETVSHMDGAIKLYKKYGFTQRETPLGTTGHFGCDLYFERSILGITFNK